MKPRERSTQSIGLYTESSIHSQATAASAIGVVQGSSTKNRTSHLKRKSAIRIIARALASTMVSAIEITVKTTVFLSARQKTSSSKMASKLRNPTQSKLGSPTVTSLNANASARSSGSATSTMM